MSKRLANLSAEEKRDLLARVLKEKVQEASRAPLSLQQQRLWFLDQLEPGIPSYNIAWVMRISGAIDIEVVQRALNEIVRRHESLRTTFCSKDGKPIQVVLQPRPLPLKIVDLSELADDEWEQEIRRLVREETRTPFNLATGPLLRVTLLRHGLDEHVASLTFHHIIADWWSFGVFVRELWVLYDAFSKGQPSPLPELPIQYRDYTRWQRQRLQGDSLDRLLSYWKGQLHGAPHVLHLRTDRPRPSVVTYNGAIASFLLPQALSESLKELSRKQGVTLFMTLLAAFSVLLHRHADQEKMLIGTPIAGRDRPETQGLIGFFVNTLTLRIDLSGNPTFCEFLKKVRDTALGAYAHQDLPFNKLVEELQSQRDLSRSPLIQVMFALQNIPMPAPGYPGFSISPLDIDTGLARFDLVLETIDTTHGIRGRFEYNTDLFDRVTIEGLARQYHSLLESIVSNPDQRISQISLLAEFERKQILFEWNATKVNYPETSCLHHLIEAQVERTPEAVAVRFEQEFLTYRELNRRANQVAHHLHRLGIGLESLVGVCVEPSLEMLVGILGVLKAGAVYLPLEPTYPQERLAFMLEDAQVSVLLTEQRLVAGLPKHVARVLCLDSDWEIISHESTENLPTPVTARNLAYVMYTSGSSGRPKGVMIEHRSLVNQMYYFKKRYLGDEGCRHLPMVTGLGFDISLRQLFALLLVGGEVWVLSRDDATQPAALVRVLGTRTKIILNCVPSLWQAILDAIDAGQAKPPVENLRCLLVGGEALSKKLVARSFKMLPDLHIWHGYGPTEATVSASVVRIVPEGDVTIGRPIANTQIYLLDSHLQPVPVGVPGELHIGGVGLARGYLKRPELTAEKFLPNPFSTEPGARLYKTGDLASHRPDGKIEFLGRLDHQVKIRGYRVELEEVEAVLGHHPAVRENVVLALGEEPGDKRLVAYVVPSREQTLTTSELRRFLQEKLPEYMVPSVFVMLESLPRMPNGKVDRQSLPAPEHVESERHELYVPPRTPTEELVADIWSQILGVERIGIHDNFFGLGGHSLLAAQIISRLCQTFQVDLPLRNLFEAPTVAGLAERIEIACQAGDRLRTEPLRPVSRNQLLPLSFGQQGLWFIDQLQRGVPFHIPIAVRFSGALDAGVLERCLNEVIRRHESLRTTFAPDGGRPVQVIAETLELPLTEVNLSELDESERRARVQRIILEELLQPFDLSRGPLLRAMLWQLNHEDHVLIVVLHHIISDGWSVQVFVRELRTLYEAFSAGAPSPLPELPIQYADFAYWQRQWFEGEEREIPQLSYWKQQLGGPLPVLELPTDHPRPAVSNFRGTTRFLVLPASLSLALRELSRREGVTLFMTLLAAFKTFLHRYTGEHDIIVGTPIAGRTRVETEGVIGFFVNLLALRTDLSGDPSFRELLSRVREVAVGAYTHQDLPYEKLVEILHPERGLSQTPLFRVMFIFQHAWPGGFLQQLGLTPKVLEREAEALPDDAMPAAYDLLLTIVDGEQEMTAALHYRSDLFDAPTIRRMLRCFQTLLEGIAANPERRLSALPILTDQERRQLLVEYNATSADYPRDRCLHERFEAQVERTPEATAVVFEEDQLTYSDLNRRANQLAHYLRRLGVGPEVLVGLYVERSVGMLVGLLGILKAGGAFVPLDPTYPKERLAFMLEDARVSVVLTEERLAGGLPNHEVPVVALDSSWEVIAQESDQNPVSGATAENLAYVIYTSGTTGNPNGVLIPHRAVVNHNVATARRLGLHPSDRILQFASISFDAAVEEIFPCLAVGATLVLRTDSMLSSVSAFLQKCHELGLTVLDLPTAYWHELTSALSANGWTLPEPVRLVIIGGERALPERVEAWRKHVGSTVRLVNTYGPTETTVVATVSELSESEDRPAVWPEVPIGRPIDNVQTYVLDGHLQPVPMGVPGELYIGGDGLARGYLNRPDLTAERFIPNPFSDEPGARLYKTGDRARYRADGHIEFLGRTDDQVKLRGFRVELSEIETKLRQHPLVEEARVIVREDVPDEKRLVAYYVPRQESGVRVAELRGFLQNQLPDYMIPSQFVPLASLPLTSTGKLDRKSLPQPGSERPDLDQGYVAPRNDHETALVGIWAELLRIDKIGVYDNFFALGGHSLLAMQLMGRVKEAFHVEIPLRILFESPTVAQLARRIEDLQSAPERAGDYTAFEVSPLVPMQPRGGNPPLFCVHPLGGQIHCYRYLSPFLGEKYAVYGIQSRALADPAREHPTLASMAADYANVICEHFPNRPYNLLGWSSGGLLAMAIGEALEQKGERVSLVGLVDTYLLAGDEIPVGIESVQNLIINLRETFEEEYPGFAHVWEHLIEQATSLYNEFLPLSDEERLERIFDWLETMKLAHGDFREVLRRQWNLHNFHYSLLKRYKPSRIHAPLCVFWASERLPGITTPSPVDWSEYTSAGVRTEIVDGNHYRIMRLPAVQTISERLAARIERA